MRRSLAQMTTRSGSRPMIAVRWAFQVRGPRKSPPPHWTFQWRDRDLLVTGPRLADSSMCRSSRSRTSRSRRSPGASSRIETGATNDRASTDPAARPPGPVASRDVHHQGRGNRPVADRLTGQAGRDRSRPAERHDMRRPRTIRRDRWSGRACCGPGRSGGFHRQRSLFPVQARTVEGPARRSAYRPSQLTIVRVTRSAASCWTKWPAPGIVTRVRSRLDPVPGVVERPGEQRLVLQAVDEEHGALDRREGRVPAAWRSASALALVGDARIIGLVIVEHPFHRRSLQRRAVDLASLRVLDPE